MKEMGMFTDIINKIDYKNMYISSVYQCVIFSFDHIFPKTKIPLMCSSLQCNLQGTMYCIALGFNKCIWLALTCSQCRFLGIV